MKRDTVAEIRNSQRDNQSIPIWFVIVMIVAGLFILGVVAHYALEKDAAVAFKVKNTRSGQAVERVEDVHFVLEGKRIELEQPVFQAVNRYLLPMEEIVWAVGSRQKELAYQQKHIGYQGYWNYPGQLEDLQKHAQYVQGMGRVKYISLFHLAQSFDLKLTWDQDKQVIGMFWRRETAGHREPPNNVYPYPRNNLDKNPLKPALIRLEDVTAGYRYASDEALAKFEVEVDYLYAQGIPFSVAWIPRYIDSKNKIDNDISRQNTWYNSHFVYLLDYMQAKNGTIGLHGYTHQYGKTRSGVGAEFSSASNPDIPKQDRYVQDRLDQAIESARRLSLPYAFFEAPHYLISDNHLQLVEKKFDTIYQGNYKRVVKKQHGTHTIWFVGAYLDFTPTDKQEDINKLISRIDQLDPTVLASFFFHPHFEFKDIVLTTEQDGYPTYNYAADSPLHQIVQAFERNDYSFVALQEVKK